MAKGARTLVVACKNCEANVAATEEGSYERYFDEPGYSVRFTLLRCPSCETAILVSQDDEDARYQEYDGDDKWSKPFRLHPVISDRALGSAVPDPIRNAFAEARSCYDEAKAYTACAIMCRKVLEGICNTHGANDGSLFQRLKQLADSGQLDKRIYEWTDAMRLVGNEAAHDVNVTVSREDANDLLDLAEAVAEYLYTVREKFEAFKKRRAAKKPA